MPGSEAVGDEESLVRRIPFTFASNPIDPSAFLLNTRRGERALSMYRTELCDPAIILVRARRPGATLAWFVVGELRAFCLVWPDPTDEDPECGEAHAAVRPTGTPDGEQIDIATRERLAYLANDRGPLSTGPR